MGTTADQIKEILCRAVNPIVARGVWRFALRQCALTEEGFYQESVTPKLIEALERGLKVMSGDDAARACHGALSALRNERTTGTSAAPRETGARQRAVKSAGSGPAPPQQTGGVTIEIQQEIDIVRARGRARGFAQMVGFGTTDQTKIATAVSEVSRNIFAYARKGTVSLLPLVGKRGLRIEARDRGPGIVGLEKILSGDYSSKTGMGLGLRGCKRLMDRFQVETAHGRGTVVIMEKEIS
jgi:serine/threonine-protein kinase RsbT